MSEPEPEHYPQDRPRAGTIRSRTVLEVASALVGRAGWPDQQARVDLRPQGAREWSTTLLGSDGPDAMTEVVGRPGVVAVINPAAAVLPAWRRLAAGRDGLPELAAITTIPSYDQLGLAVDARLGIGSLDELAAARPALRVSLRGGRPNHSVHLVLADVLAAAGLALADFEAWGGSVHHDEGLPHQAVRRRLIESGEAGAVIDEGVYNWVDLAVTHGLRFLDVPAAVLDRLAGDGYRPATIRAGRYPALDRDATTVDFSGFLLYTRADTDDRVVGQVCDALQERRDRIAWQGGPSLPLERMWTDALDAPVPIPLHPAARRYWERLG